MCARMCVCVCVCPCVTQVTGRARLGGIPVGVIAVETQTVVRHQPADPGMPDSTEQHLPQAGQVCEDCTNEHHAILRHSQRKVRLAHRHVPSPIAPRVVRAYACSRLRVLMCVHVCLCLCVCAHVCVCACLCVCVCVCRHTGVVPRQCP